MGHYELPETEYRCEVALNMVGTERHEAKRHNDHQTVAVCSERIKQLRKRLWELMGLDESILEGG